MNACAENQQITYDKEDDFKVQIAHIPIPNTIGSKLIPLLLPDSVANVKYNYFGSEELNSYTQLVKKQRDEMRSDADASVMTKYQ